jgi:hypothetical protein
MFSHLTLPTTPQPNFEPGPVRGTIVKKFGLASIVAGGLAAAVLGLAAPAQAGVAHHRWVNHLGAHATAPQVDTSVHQSR